MKKIWKWEITIFKDNVSIFQETVYFGTQKATISYTEWLCKYKGGTGFNIKRDKLIWNEG